MAKIMKKWMAMTLALCLCIGAVVTPVTAGTVTDTKTEEILNGDQEVIGTKVTVTTTSSEQVNPFYYESSTNEQTDWSSQDTEGSEGTPVQDGNVTTTVDTETTTTVTGSQTKQDDFTHDSGVDKEFFSGSTSGSEETNITDKTTTTTVTSGDLYVDEDGQTVTTKDGEVHKDNWEEPRQTGTTGWTADSGNNQTGTYTETEGTRQTSDASYSGIDVDQDPLSKTDVSLNMDAPTGNKPSTDSQKVTVTVKDALENDIPYADGAVLADGSIVEYIRENGKVVGYTITRKTPEAPAPSNMEDVQAGTAGAPVNTGGETTTYVKPEGYTVCTDVPIYDQQGTQIGTKTVEEILDANGAVIGYRITEVEKISETESDRPTTTEPGVTPTVAPVLPEKPAAPAPVTDESGLTTTVTVEDLMEDGVHVGYTTITRVTDPEGNEVSMESESIYHTVFSHTSEITKDPETEIQTKTTVTEILGTLTTQNFSITTPGTLEKEQVQDVSQDVYQLVETENGLFFLYKGVMYAVTGTASNKASTEVGSKQNVDMQGFVGSGARDDDDLRRYGDYLSASGDYIDDYYTNQTFKKYSESYNPPGSNYAHVGYGLFSDFVVKETNGKAHTAKQFKITNGSEVLYVYCVELGAGISAGTNYGQDTYTVSQDSKSPWKGASGTIEQLRSVSLNGYWGTEEGLGSLEAVKDLMRRNGLEAEADQLTAGMAVAATQVAIWNYGAKNSGMFGGEDYNFVSWDDGRGGTPSAADRNTIIALRDLLIELAEDPSGSGKAEEISADSITGAGFVLKEKTEKQDAQKNDIYNTNVTFTLDVSTSSLNGDLIVKVIVDGKEVGGGRLAGEDNFSLFKWGKIYPDDNGVYTIENVQLAENVVVTLNLEGTQHLDDGVYVFEGNNGMQDFVGLSKLEREVDLEVNMSFSVTDPEAKVEYTSATWQENRTDVESYTRTDNYQKTRNGTVTTQSEMVNTKVYGTTTEVAVETRSTDSHREWSSWYAYQLMVVDGDDGGKEEKKDDHEGHHDKEDEYDGNDIAIAPKTGDITLVLAMISVLCAVGLILLNRKQEDYGR